MLEVPSYLKETRHLKDLLFVELFGISIPLMPPESTKGGDSQLSERLVVNLVVSY
jgi:hypothetical protein